MKRFTCIILTILLCGSLFLTTGFPSNAMPGYAPIGHAPVHRGLSFNYHLQPNVLNTFNNLFPIYSYQKKVCRRPFTSHFFMKGNHFIPFSAHYNFQGFSYQSIQLGSHFLKVKGNSIFKNGNSLLLIPHSYIVPTKPAFRPEMPQMVTPSN